MDRKTLHPGNGEEQEEKNLQLDSQEPDLTPKKKNLQFETNEHQTIHLNPKTPNPRIQPVFDEIRDTKSEISDTSTSLSRDRLNLSSKNRTFLSNKSQTDLKSKKRQLHKRADRFRLSFGFWLNKFVLPLYSIFLQDKFKTSKDVRGKVGWCVKFIEGLLAIEGIEEFVNEESINLFEREFNPALRGLKFNYEAVKAIRATNLKFNTEEVIFSRKIIDDKR